MPDSPSILDVTEATFQQEVVERSREVPVVVDFWAPWCGPCRLLGPLLEKAAKDAAGKFVLAKVDIDRSPGLATSFGVSSIPTVVAVRGGQIIDSFLGVLPERELEAWLQRIQPSEAEILESEAQGLEAGDPAAAEAKYREALKLAPTDAAAQIGLARAASGPGLPGGKPADRGRAGQPRLSGGRGRIAGRRPGLQAVRGRVPRTSKPPDGPLPRHRAISSVGSI